jgi:hypothetical protein
MEEEKEKQSVQPESRPKVRIFFRGKPMIGRHADTAQVHEEGRQAQATVPQTQEPTAKRDYES